MPIKHEEKLRVALEEFTDAILSCSNQIAGWRKIESKVEVPDIIRHDEKGTVVRYPGSRKPILYPFSITKRWDGYRQLLEDIVKTKSYRRLFGFLPKKKPGEMHLPFSISSYVTKTLRGDMPPEGMVQSAYEEVLGLPTTWRMNVYLQGLSIERSPLELGTVRIRKPIGPDFASWTDYDYDEEKGVPYPIEEIRMEPVDAIASWEVKGIPKKSDSEELLKLEMHRLVSQLQLAKVGRIRPVAWTAETDWVLFSSRRFENRRLEAIPSLSLDSMIPKVSFGDTEAALYAKLEKEVFSKESKHKNTRIRIRRARTMYEDSLHRPPLELLLFGVFGLETLFSDGSAEIRLKLSIRVAGMLKYLGEEAKIVYSDVGDAYKVRNDFVHGSEIKEEDKKKVPELAGRILEYLRKCILAWAQIPDDVDPIKYRQLLNTTAFIDETDVFQPLESVLF